MRTASSTDGAPVRAPRRAERTTARVLVVEDEPEFADLLSVWLSARGWDPIVASDGPAALSEFDGDEPDVVLLDVSLPGLDGWRVLERIRAVSDTPVLMVTARGAESDRLRGLGGGADDYLTKPFGFPELIARIEVALRRSSPAGRAGRAGTGDAGSIRRHGDVVVDVAGHRVIVGRDEVRLSPTEFRLLSCLIERSGAVVAHEHLLADVWGPGYGHEHHLLQVTVRSLRAKLQRVDDRPRIVSVYGVGYRLQG